MAASSKTQATISQSSAESELLAINSGVCEAKFLQSMCDELQMPISVEAYTDSTACIGAVHRRGLGRMRHLAVKELRMQEEIKQGHVTIHHVPSAVNPADLLTKALPRPRFEQLSAMFGLRSWAVAAAALGLAVPAAGFEDDEAVAQAGVSAVLAEQPGDSILWTAVVYGCATIGAYWLMTKGVQLCGCCRRRPALVHKSAQTQVTWTGLRGSERPRFTNLPPSVVDTVS